MRIAISEHFTYKKLIKFTLPTIIMMIFTSIYGVVDGLFISNVVGSDAFAAVNLIMPAIMIVGALGFMMGTGGSAIVSKTIGEGDTQKANRYFSMLMYFEIILGIIFTIAGLFTLEPIAKLLGATNEMMEYCLTYGRILLFGMTFFLLQNSFQSFIVVANKPQFGLFITVIAGVTNMILDAVFVYICKWGVAGAAWATVISQIIGAIIPLLYFMRENNSLLKLVKTKFELKPILKTCSNGSSEMVTNLSMSLVNMLYNAQLMKYIGADGVTAYGIIMYVGFIFVGVYFGYSVGTAPIIGYNYGAGNTDELKSFLKKSLKLLGISAITLTALAELFAGILANIFVSYNAELVALTSNAIRLFAISYIISWLNIFASSFFTALNDGLVSAIISFMRTLVFQVIMILVLPGIAGINGIWLAVVVAEVLSSIVSIFYLIKKKNKYQYA